jgi:hypothetical protein
VQTRHGSPAGIQLIAFPVPGVARSSAPRVAKTPTRFSIRASNGIVTHASIRNLIRSLDYALAFGVALLCSYWILLGRW